MSIKSIRPSDLQPSDTFLLSPAECGCLPLGLSVSGTHTCGGMPTMPACRPDLVARWVRGAVAAFYHGHLAADVHAEQEEMVLTFSTFTWTSTGFLLWLA